MSIFIDLSSFKIGILLMSQVILVIVFSLAATKGRIA
jgi:hypothetical protein